LLAVGAARSCLPFYCDESGCDAASRPVTGASISTGIAGVVAGASDLELNGCSECPFSGNRLFIWSAAAPIVDQKAARALAAAGPPTFTVDADERYEQPLPPGSYLVCARYDSCTALEIRVNEVFTVNVVNQMITQLHVWPPGAGQPLTVPEFHLPLP
jgi:hypothetical protein